MSTHSFLPPSGAKAWSVCAMWPSMNEAYPQDDSPESIEGTAAHWVWEQMLGRLPVKVGDVAPNGYIVTQEMVEGAELYLSVLPDVGYEFLVVETPVAIPSVHPNCYGTPDTWYYHQASKTIYLYDYKFGHRYVDEYENLQCIMYAEGIINRLALMYKVEPGVLDQQINVVITIVQPRCYYKGEPVRSWELRGSDVRGYINKLAAAAERAMSPDPVATTNEEACRNCPGRHACPALQLGAYSDLQYSTQSSPVELPLAAASLELKMMENGLARLQARVEGMREFVASQVAKGGYSAYYRLQDSYGHRTWNKPHEEVLAIGELFEKDLSKRSVVTPTQALKIGIDESVIMAYSYIPKGEPKLVVNDPNDAAKIFNKE